MDTENVQAAILNLKKAFDDLTSALKSPPISNPPTPDELMERYKWARAIKDTEFWTGTYYTGGKDEGKKIMMHLSLVVRYISKERDVDGADGFADSVLQTLPRR